MVWKRHRSLKVERVNLTNLCLFVYQWRMYVNLLEALNRAGAPSSIRHSQQPFLVLDGAVRMHRLICPPSAARGMHSSSKRTGRQDLRGVSTHKDRWIGTRKGTLNIQNVTVRAGGPGRGVSTQRAVPCLRHAGSPQFSDTGTRLVVLNVAFSQKQRRAEVGTSAGSHPLKKKKKKNDSKYITHVHPTLLNFPLTLTHMRVKIHPCLELHPLPCAETRVDLPVTWQAEWLQENGLNRQLTSHTSWEVNTRPVETVCVVFPRYFTALAPAEITRCNCELNIFCGRLTSSSSCLFTQKETSLVGKLMTASEFNYITQLKNNTGSY